MTTMAAIWRNSERPASREGMPSHNNLRNNNNNNTNTNTCDDDNGCVCGGCVVSTILHHRESAFGVGSGVVLSRRAVASLPLQQQRRQQTSQHERGPASRLRLFGEFIIQSGECQGLVAQPSAGRQLQPAVQARRPRQSLIVGLGGWRLFALALVAGAGAAMWVAPTADGSPLAFIGDDSNNNNNSPDFYVDTQCNQLKSRASSNGYAWKKGDLMMMILRCDMVPIIENLQSARQTLGSPLVDNSSKLMLLRSKVEDIWPLAWRAFQMNEFCTYNTFEVYRKLRDLMVGQGQGLELLESLYDVMAIELHTECLAKALKNLPRIPSLVRSTVDIYVHGADQKPLDLNEVPDLLANKRLDELHFDAREAIRKNGPLASVVGLSLGVNLGPGGGLSEQDFREQCHSYFADIDERWQSMEIMNSMMSTDGNGIEGYNNYMMHLIIALRYAHICSELTRV